MAKNTVTSSQIEFFVDNKGLPASIEAERLALGALFIASDIEQSQIIAECKAEWFTTIGHKAIYGAAIALLDSGARIDYFAVAQSLLLRLVSRAGRATSWDSQTEYRSI